VFAANGAMIYLAVSTFGGLDTADAYRKGLAYNERIVAGVAQEQRGWRGSLAYLPGTQRLRVALRDHAGMAVSGLVLSGDIGRPATDRYDRPLSFAQTGPGTYEADAASIEPGWWTVDVRAHGASGTGGEVLYESKERLWIKP
jgi:nitrogen fixation protein FixH